MINEVQEIGGIYGGKHWECIQRHRVYGTWGISPVVTLDGGGMINILIDKDMEEKCLTPRRNLEPQVKEIGNLYKGQTAWESNQRGRVYDDKGIAPTLYDYSHGGGLEPKVPIDGKKYRIRKLTERECFRLMDVDEADIDTIQASGISKTQQYKMAGNSIVVSCLYHLFRKMFVEAENEERQLTLF